MDKLLAPIENLMGYLMAQIYSVIPSVGIAIIIVTLLVMLLIYPLTHKQTKSMIATQALQPQIKALQAKYKDDRQKLSEETMALYKTAGVNPLGGCLPTLIQMPFLFSIFRVVGHIEKFVDPNQGLKPSGKLFTALCAPAQTAELCKANAGKMVDAKIVSPENAEALARKLPVGKEFLGLNLSKSLVGIADKGFTSVFPYVVLIVLLATASYISISRQQRINPNTPSQMKFLKYLLPVAISVSGVILPAGPNLYILTSSIWRACQQEFLFIKLIKPHREKHAKNAAAIPSPPEADADSEDALSDKKNTNHKAGQARQKRKKKK